VRLILIRHGQTPANVIGALATAHPGPGLTELGEVQAREVPHALRGDAIDAIYASTLARTQQTAYPLAEDRGLDVRILAGIHEIEAGSLEDRRDHEAVRAYLTAAFAWGSGNLDERMPGGTDGHEFFARFDGAVREIAAELSGGGINSDPSIALARAATDPTAVVFSHGAAIRVWVAGRAVNVPPSFVGEQFLDNTGVVELEGTPDGGWTLLSWQGTPVGGRDLADESAEDPTGESLDEALEG
jgi:broad specificity phosphatase PhoE